jgi:hypothetical protein
MIPAGSSRQTSSTSIRRSRWLDDAWRVENLNSSNGTFVDDVPVHDGETDWPPRPGSGSSNGTPSGNSAVIKPGAGGHAAYSFVIHLETVRDSSRACPLA